MSSLRNNSLEIEVRPINGHIGAEIRNIDLSRNLAAEEFKIVEDALVRYEVIVFRDQSFTLDQQIEFTKRFGPLSVHPFAPNMADKPEVITVDSSGDNPAGPTDGWHSDETFRARPPMATILRARTMPPYGGDTLFASMTAAYDGLSEQMKRYIHDLEVLHDFKPWRHMFEGSPELRARLRKLEDEYPNPWHPVVRIHPVSKRRVLFVNALFSTRIKGLTEDESRSILDFLCRQATIPDYQLRIKWQPNTVVMWDNRSTQHYAPHDYYPHHRKLDRLTVAGGAVTGPVGPYTPQEPRTDSLVQRITAHGLQGRPFIGNETPAAM